MITRRQLLGAMGGAAAVFPWLRAQRAHAADAPIPRLILFFTPHGTVWDQWRPTGTETAFALSPILEPLAAHQQRMIVVDGLRIVSGTDYYIPHTYTMPVLWTGSPIDTSASGFCRADHGGRCFGWNTGPSVDQVIASRLPTTTPYGSIELGVGTGGLHPATRMIYSAPAMPKTAIDDPVRAFATLFGSVDEGVRTARKRAAVLDVVRRDLGAHRARLSAADRLRLDAHATAIEDLERALVPSTALCTRPALPMGVSAETIIDHQSDLAAAALGCGLTRIVSLQVRIADNDGSLYPWVGLTTGGHHGLSHDSSAPAQATLAQVYRWYAGRFAHLLDRLANTPDGDGQSVLDNSLVIWGSELGRAWDHDISNVPFVLAGGAAGRLRGGRYLRVTGRHNRLLVTALHAMGVTDVDRFGTLDDDVGPLTGALS